MSTTTVDRAISHTIRRQERPIIRAQLDQPRCFGVSIGKVTLDRYRQRAACYGAAPTAPSMKVGYVAFAPP